MNMALSRLERVPVEKKEGPSGAEAKLASAPPTPHASTSKSGYSHLSSPSAAGAPPLPRQLGHVHVVTMQERVQRLMDGRIGITLEVINVALSVLLVVIAIAHTYTYENDSQSTNPKYNAFELGCTVLFSIDLALRTYAAEDPAKVLFSPMGIIDIITIVPTYLALFLASLSGSILPLLRVLRIFRMLAVLRLYRVVESYQGYDYELAVLIFTIVAVILVAAGVMQVLDEEYYRELGQPLQFHQAVYFVFVTISTIGYGDITPKSTIAQLFVILIIGFVLTVIPVQVNRIAELSQLQSGYMTSYTPSKRGRQGGHVVVTGDVSYDSISSFLREFYDSRQGLVDMDVVVLADRQPSRRLAGLLRQTQYQRRVYYLHGSLLHDKDAARARVESAAAVFVLANTQPTLNPKTADATLVLNLLSSAKQSEIAARDASPVPWIAEYSRGLQHQLFPAKLLRELDGVSWEDAVEWLYVNCEVMLIAVHDPSEASSGGRRRRIRLSPSGYRLNEGDTVFLIATSAAAAHRAVGAFASVVGRKAETQPASDGAKAERTVLAFSSHSCETKAALACLDNASSAALDHVAVTQVSAALSSAAAAFSPPFAAGEIFVDGALDTLLCQSYFNAYIIDLVRALVGDTRHRNRNWQQRRNTRSCSRSVDAGDVEESSSEDSHEKPAAANAEDAVALVSMPVPRELEGETFGCVFQKMLEAGGSLVIGVYRRARDPRRGNVLPYVVTCPPAGMAVERGDALFVLPSTHGRRRASTCPA
ncbi:hypothetical protein ATCC90586_007268 [Pythium insidiosum]|nr:hypothetical protein ATCC90586_007268 [Pythium insidiosum]